jgi:pyruvate kinase
VRRAKIVATLGPSLDDPERLRAALAAGIDVVRLNFSHGTLDEHARRLDLVRSAAASLGRNVGSLGDLQGPKIRLGVLPDVGVALADGQEVVLRAGVERLDSYDDGAGTPVLPVVYEQFAADVEPGALVLIDDGVIRLVVSRIDGTDVTLRVVAGGTASSRKGVNLPGVDVSARALTDKDREDVKAMVDLGVEWIALSFVRRAADVIEVRDLIHTLGGEAPVIAKLERPEAVHHLDEIIEATDAVMVARGDLGVEVGPERVPALQKQIIQMANREAKPVITATEMLDSMIRSPRPTRAEASDVANAVFDGTDALMLSGETAAGRFPVEAVRTMARIIEVAESSQNLVVTPPPPREGIALPRVVSRAAVQVAADLNAKALLVFSLSGASVQLVSKFRPPVPLFGLCPREAPLRRLSLMWGTEGVMVPTEDNSRALTLAAERVCIRQGIASAGDPIVIVSGVPGGHGGTNRLLVHRIGEAPD